ncbi:hypothetical protein [Tuwongella immobilis]|uniref:DUF3035 domain-containing protein n=1 Tax=Tuwongella immobilis TaxID=692036 RepID=A0A6C2YHU9_9BACT|nr:hypothetical protein [Tuwongella immobilis]VIP00839.1 unnamed protein product [Tuwongella immobilis]VTR97096.1 unnamed protein product [Tuwongella immobilis]
MHRARRWGYLCMTGLGLAIVSLSGCQTWEGGQTLPSGRYLEHPPQYILPDPPFPLTRELADQEEKAGLLNGLPRDGAPTPAAAPAVPTPVMPAPIPAPAAPAAPAAPPGN